MMDNLNLILAITSICLFLWLTGLSVFFLRLRSKYNRLTKGVKKKELLSILENSNTLLQVQKQATDKLERWIKNLEADAEFHIQKVGFVRFNPFTDTGGNQSFCLVFLDQHNDGVVISSLHSREQTRIYAKAIKNGKTKGFELSKEEQEALKRAKSNSSGGS